MLKATKVDGVYTADPMKDPTATRYDHITFTDALTQNLGVMDATALVMCRENNLPIKVFNIFNEGDLMKVVKGENVGTLVSETTPQ